MMEHALAVIHDGIILHLFYETTTMLCLIWLLTDVLARRRCILDLSVNG
jgi:hypothetical protein